MAATLHKAEIEFPQKLVRDIRNYNSDFKQGWFRFSENPLLLLLTEHHATKAYWGVEAQLHTFLT
jgi:hypothetical protein